MYCLSCGKLPEEVLVFNNYPVKFCHRCGLISLKRSEIFSFCLNLLDEHIPDSTNFHQHLAKTWASKQIYRIFRTARRVETDMLCHMKCASAVMVGLCECREIYIPKWDIKYYSCIVEDSMFVDISRLLKVIDLIVKKAFKKKFIYRRLLKALGVY